MKKLVAAALLVGALCVGWTTAVESSVADAAEVGAVAGSVVGGAGQLCCVVR